MKENFLKVFKSFIAFMLSLVLVLSTSFCVVMAEDISFIDNSVSYHVEDGFLYADFQGSSYKSIVKIDNSVNVTWTNSTYDLLIDGQPVINYYGTHGYISLSFATSSNLNYCLFFDSSSFSFCLFSIFLSDKNMIIQNLNNCLLPFFTVSGVTGLYNNYLLSTSSVTSFRLDSTNSSSFYLLNGISYYFNSSKKGNYIPVITNNNFYGLLVKGFNGFTNVPAEYQYNYLWYDESKKYYTFLTWSLPLGRAIGSTFYSSEGSRGLYKIYFSSDGSSWVRYGNGFSGTINYSISYFSDSAELLYRDSNYGQGGTSYVEFEDSENDIPENPDLTDIIENLQGSDPDSFLYHGTYDLMIATDDGSSFLSLSDLTSSCPHVYVYKCYYDNYKNTVLGTTDLLNYDYYHFIYSNSSNILNYDDPFYIDFPTYNSSSGFTYNIGYGVQYTSTDSSVRHNYYRVTEQVMDFETSLSSNFKSVDNLIRFVTAFDLFQSAQLGKLDSLYTRLGTVNKNIGGLLSTLTTIDQSIKSIKFDDSNIIDAINNIQVTVPSSDSEVSLIDDQFTQLLDAIEESASDSVGITDDQINTITDAIQDNSGLTSLQYAGLLNAINGINAPDYAPDYDPDDDPNVPWWSFVTSGLTGAAAGTVFGTLESYFNDEYFGGQLLAGMGFVGDSMQRFFETVPAAQPILIGGCVFLVADVVLRKNGV